MKTIKDLLEDIQNGLASGDLELDMPVEVAEYDTDGSTDYTAIYATTNRADQRVALICGD